VFRVLFLFFIGRQKVRFFLQRVLHCRAALVEDISTTNTRATTANQGNQKEDIVEERLLGGANAVGGRGA
jgi:hypothetical protein